jgi:hypothetical protein
LFFLFDNIVLLSLCFSLSLSLSLCFM